MRLRLLRWHPHDHACSIDNLPGQSALRYRVGTQAAFLESMIAGLTLSGDEQLRKLGTRSHDDPAIAFLDSWATVGDILTFYQEHIANEGYLRTAVERQSVLELARLVGYHMRPGVSASVYLAYMIDPAFTDESVIPAGTKSTGVPAPGETQQTFETSDELLARAKWNVLQPRLTRPQTMASIAGVKGRIYLQGIAANLKANDPLLIAPDVLFRVDTVNMDTIANRTLVENTGNADETVLGRGPWTRVVPKATVAAAFPGLGACTGAGNSTFRAKGRPNDTAMFEANRRHEDHHVADHTTVFNNTVGRWDTRLTTARAAGTTFNRPTEAAAEAALHAAMGGTPDQIADAQLNDRAAAARRFHGTPSGGAVTTENPASDATCTTSEVTSFNPS